VQQPAAQLYARLVAGIRQRIRTAQVRTALAANAELVMLYWEIGRDILIAQQREGWGAKVIDRLAADLRSRISASGRLLSAKPEIHAGLC
jgi:hypothetical protein